jgi:hypothetical protein
LPILLGVAPADGQPEELVITEADARNVFDEADSSGPGTDMLKAQLLAAKLNAIKFPGFADAQLPSGEKVGDLIAQADQILDDLSNEVAHSHSEVVALSELLDAANNNGEGDQVLVIGEGCPTPTATPSPTPTAVAGEVTGPSPTPGTLPRTGSGLRSGGYDTPTAALLGVALLLASLAAIWAVPRRRP